MPYARLDDRYHEHRKIRRAFRREPAAVALHAMAITYSNQHVTDGEIDAEWVEERLALLPYKPSQRAKVLEVLIELRLLERKDEDTFLIHDFLDWNLSSEQRKRLAAQGQRGGKSKGSSLPNGDGSGPGSSKGLSKGLSDGLSPAGTNGLSTPSPSPTPTPSQRENTNVELRSTVLEIFGYWQERCEHRQARLGRDRRSKIEARLREGYTVHQIRKAIDGAAKAAFVSDGGRRFDDIELICRNSAKLESFIARADATVVPMPSATARMNAWQNAPEYREDAS